MINNTRSSFENLSAAFEDPRLRGQRLQSTTTVDSADPLLLEMHFYLTNKRLRKVAQEILNNEVPELQEIKGVSIVTTGSDARGEKFGNRSPIELIVVAEEASQLTPSLLKKIQATVEQHSDLFDSLIETKVLQRDSLINFTALGQPKEIPTRYFDARHLAGSKDTSHTMKKKCVAEIKLSKLKKFKKDSLAFIFRSLKKTSSIDFETGRLLTGPKSGGLIHKSTKQPLLRPVQYQTANLLFDWIKKHPEEAEAKLDKIPRSTIGRIAWLYDQGLISMNEEQIQHLLQAYTAAQIWFCTAETALAEQNQGEIYVDPQALQEAVKTVQSYKLAEIRR